MQWYIFCLIGIIVMLSMGLESITGFGATVLALPFLTLLLPVKTAVPLMSMMSLLLGLWILARQFRLVDWGAIRAILLWTGLGMPIGMLGFRFFPERALRLILGCFVIAAAIKALLDARNASKHVQAGPNRAVNAALLFLGGIFHGAFSCGGPLIVVCVSKKIQEKSVFRATLTTVWVILNTVLLVKHLMAGDVITGDFLLLWIGCIPFFAAGAAAGNWLHGRVGREAFSLAANLLLLAAGGSTLIAAL